MAVPFGNQAVSSQMLDHLGLVAGMYEQLGIGEELDALIPQDLDQRVVSVGQAVKAMVLNGLGFVNQTLYLTPQFYQTKPTERLIGAGIQPAHLNDDTLGRALDRLYEHDVTALFTRVSARACMRLGLTGGGSAHLDTTSFHLDGDYNQAQGAKEGVVHITPGYSRDHRPELNQVGLSLIVGQRARLPLLMQPLSGNTNDTSHFAEVIERHLDNLTAAHGIEYWVADSALYSEANLKRLSAHGVKWITRVPETVGRAQAALADPRAGELLQPGYLGRALTLEYGGVEQRWVVVTSLAALQRAAKRVTTQLATESEQEYKAFAKLCRKTFACEADARQALAEFAKGLQVLSLEEPAVMPVPKARRGKGYSGTGSAAEIIGYRLTGCPAMACETRLLRLYRQGRFILATNELATDRLDSLAVLQTYKEQGQVERGFRFLKDPQFQANTFYLKSPKRIMALLMVMTVCLLVYAALEYRFRSALAARQETFPDQRGRPVTNPTLRWVFQCFIGIHLLLIADQAPLVLNLNERHQQVIQLLGPPYQRLYE